MTTDWLATLQWMIPSPPVMATHAGNKRFVPIRQPLTPVSPVQWVAAADGFEHIILGDGQGSVGDATPLGTVTAVDSDGILGGISFSTGGSTFFYSAAGERLALSGTIPAFTGGDFVLTGTHTDYLGATTSSLVGSLSGGGFDAVTESSDHFRDNGNVEFGSALANGPPLPPGGVFLTTAVVPATTEPYSLTLSAMSGVNLLSAVSVTANPEPGTVLLSCIGGFLILGRQLRRRRPSRKSQAGADTSEAS